MKFVIMTFLLWGGMTLTQVNAQSCDQVCLPGCCIVSCCTSTCTSGSAVKTAGDSHPASCSVKDLSKYCAGSKMSKKEMKACQAACEASKASATADHQHVAQPAQAQMACQPADTASPKGREAQRVRVADVVHPAAAPVKG